MFTSCKPCHQVYQGTVQCFSALPKREKVLFFPIKALALLVYFKVNKCVCDSQPPTVGTCEIVCVIPNLCILRFVSLLPFFFFDQSHTDFSCNINFKSNNNNSERETTLITKSQIDWNQDLSQPSVDLSAATFATAAVSSSVVQAFLRVRDFLAPQVLQ